jgi:hypothetical protein
MLVRIWEQSNPLYTVGGNINECRLCGSSWKKKQLKIELPYDLEIPLLGIYLKECKSGYNRNIYTFMLIEALFTITKLWNQSRWLSTDEWIKKMWYIHTYSAIKKNEVMSLAGKWKLGDHHIKQHKPCSERKFHVFSYMSYLDLKYMCVCNCGTGWGWGKGREQEWWVMNNMKNTLYLCMMMA